LEHRKLALELNVYHSLFPLHTFKEAMTKALFSRMKFYLVELASSSEGKTLCIIGFTLYAKFLVEFRLVNEASIRTTEAWQMIGHYGVIAL
jgi:hypothetical protein